MRQGLRNGWAGVVAVIVLLVVSCAPLPPQSQAPIVELPAVADETATEISQHERQVQAESVLTPQTVTSAYSPAVVALLGRANEMERSGQPDLAAAVIERALRIEPRNARLWHRLAEVHLAQGLWQNAANVAEKSNALAGEDIDLQIQNWDVIAEARARQGDVKGARGARERLSELRARSR